MGVCYAQVRTRAGYTHILAHSQVHYTYAHVTRALYMLAVTYAQVRAHAQISWQWHLRATYQCYDIQVQIQFKLYNPLALLRNRFITYFIVQ
jgi:hypothetical protein